MTIQFIDTNPLMIEALKNEFGDEENMVFHVGQIFDLPTNCVVSPANSFGFMDGGLDLVISKHLGWQVQKNLQELIQSQYHGELLVGQALLFNTDNLDVPYCIASPTMRVPLILTESVNVYLAARATFRCIYQNLDKIETVSISGFGTGVGRMSVEMSARQMKMGWDHMLMVRNNFPRTWLDAKLKHEILYQ